MFIGAQDFLVALLPLIMRQPGMSRSVGIIPARYLSTRFPGKPLVDIAGKSMIWRVYEQCLKARGLEQVYVATDDNRIFNEVTSKGGKAIMTDSQALNGTVRCINAYNLIAEAEGGFDYLINIQGDEPFINPEQISEVIQLINATASPIATLVKDITDIQDLWDENVVKVVVNEANQAMYFSRQAIPFIRDADRAVWLQKWNFIKHIGIYAFKTDVLPVINRISATPLENVENLEQLRWLGHQLSIAVTKTNYPTIAIDTPADLEKAIQYVQSTENL